MKEQKTYLFYVVLRICVAVSSLQLKCTCPLVFQNLGGGFNSNLIQARSEKNNENGIKILSSLHFAGLSVC